jgi:hypothetical protein
MRGVSRFTLTMAKLAPSLFTLAQSTLPCHPETSHPFGFDRLSREEGLALTRARDAAMIAKYFMMEFVWEVWRRWALKDRYWEKFEGRRMY